MRKLSRRPLSGSKIKWTKQAKSDLYDIYRFIARDSTRYAQIQIENIQNAVSNLANFSVNGP